MVDWACWGEDVFSLGVEYSVKEVFGRGRAEEWKLEFGRIGVGRVTTQY